MDCKRTPVGSWLRPAIALGLLVGLASVARADDRHVGTCSNATLNGAYGYYRTGFTPDGPLAAVGIIRYDGGGNAVTTQSISRNGEIDFDVTFPGLYEVNPDCTGKGLTTDGIEFARLMVVNDGSGFIILSESSGNTVYGVGTRVRDTNGNQH